MSNEVPGFQYTPNAAPEQADVLIVPVPHEMTVCARGGTAQGPNAILEAAGQLEYFEEDMAWSPLLHMKASVSKPWAMEPGQEEGAYHAYLQQQAVHLYHEKRLFIGLGGEHSITPSLVAGLMPEPGTIVLLDAHADLRRSYQGSPYSHAAPMHRLREQGHNIIMLGVRSLFETEARRIQEDDAIRCYFDRELQHTACWQQMLAALRAVQGPCWLTIDMDVFDPGLVPGVGTPQPGGLNWFQVLDIVQTLLLDSGADIRGADIVELIPDDYGVSPITAAKLLQKIISFWGKRHGYDQRPATGSQSLISYE